jgi:hypothetical protein
MPCTVSTVNSTPTGTTSTAARRSAVLNEAFRKLPDIPTILVIRFITFIQIGISPYSASILSNLTSQGLAPLISALI